MKPTAGPLKLFFAALLIGAVLRFWALGAVPPSPDWDEAALGYNAYSILKTGRDEYGTKYPLVLRSFDDYKPPLYAYLTIPSVALFGLNVWAVRLPSAIAGVLAIAGVYVLTGLLLDAGGLTRKKYLGIDVPSFAALLLALSPWHIQFSRIAFEANVGLTINIWAIALFLKGLRNRMYLPVSAFLLGLGLYAYHSERVFLPLMALVLLVLFRKQFFSGKRSAVLFFLVGMLTVLPLLPVVTNKDAITRLQGTSALADETGLLTRSVTKLEYDKTHGIWWGKILDNRRIVWAETLINGYLSHFSFKWLFLTGDNARHHAPGMGLLYLWELPFLLYGMFLVTRKGGRMAGVLWSWFLIAPVAAAPTTELPHAIRTLVFLPAFQIFAAVGVGESVGRIGGLFRKRQPALGRAAVVFGVSCSLLFAALNIAYYLHMYFGHTDEEYSQYWQYGYKEAVAYADAHHNEYTHVVVSTRLEQPYMFFLFYLRYDPAAYLARGGTRSGGFAEDRNSLENYEFRPIHWSTEKPDGPTLYIGTPREIPGPGLLTIRYLDGSPAMVIASR
ncbi:glycosyltransferase family 39 protein [Patescibacteria group bacterium]|nr:glycosyltransferase family 39 protein [Patescibacteria group bacterium]